MLDLWGDDGDFSDAGEDYHKLQDELSAHPETLCEQDLLHIMSIFDDSCYELSWQNALARILARNMIFFGEDRMCVYLDALDTVPTGGRYHGWKVTVQMLLTQKDAAAVFERTVMSRPVEVKALVAEILQSIKADIPGKDDLINKLT